MANETNPPVKMAKETRTQLSRLEKMIDSRLKQGEDPTQLLANVRMNLRVMVNRF